ncbi:MAG: gamma-glutamyl-gamma-aminobutyrate hydrolase family protein [Gluconacetobacter diazotrophicus]|nr:gamma-glutamyl-gamma-aminobutyrate hydrolase family protein [Gluconacetobacter diazotrophicus]
MHLLVADSETAEQRRVRRATVGSTSAESYAATLETIAPGARCEIVRPHEDGPGTRPVQALEAYDAVFLSGSPMHVHEDTPEARRQIAFMRAVFAAGTPSFGSCAGLQIAVAAAGGVVGEADRYEAGFARRICASAAGRSHPLLAGRPASWDALAIHSDAVVRLPPGATLLAGNAVCPVQAVEIRFDRGLFWGVQYHPELTLPEIAAALRRQDSGLVEAGFARGEADIEHQAVLIDALAAEPARRDLAWRLGIDDEIIDTAMRQRELRNFVGHLRPSR